jgi:hypothetical protein
MPLCRICKNWVDEPITHPVDCRSLRRPEKTEYFIEVNRLGDTWHRQIDPYKTLESAEDSAWYIRRLSPRSSTRIVRVTSRVQIVSPAAGKFERRVV